MDDGDCHRTFPYYACIYNVCSPNGASYIVANSERSVVKWRNIWWKTYHQHRADLQTFLLCLFLVRFVYFIFFVPAWSCWCGLSFCRSERQYSDWSHKFRISMNTAGHTLTIFLLFFVSPYGTNTFARILSISHLDCWFLFGKWLNFANHSRRWNPKRHITVSAHSFNGLYPDWCRECTRDFRLANKKYGGCVYKTSWVVNWWKNVAAMHRSRPNRCDTNL